jgi:hypothetical protein
MRPHTWVANRLRVGSTARHQRYSRRTLDCHRWGDADLCAEPTLPQ